MLCSAWNSRHNESVNMMLLRVIDVSIGVSTDAKFYLMAIHNC